MQQIHRSASFRRRLQMGVECRGKAFAQTSVTWVAPAAHVPHHGAALVGQLYRQLMRDDIEIPRDLAMKPAQQYSDRSVRSMIIGTAQSLLEA